MPCVASSHRRIQRTFAPLVFRSRVPPERVWSHSPLPWDVAYPPHVDGVIHGASLEKQPATKTKATKKKKPYGEPNRNSPKGYWIKDELEISDELYKEIEVSVCH